MLRLIVAISFPARPGPSPQLELLVIPVQANAHGLTHPLQQVRHSHAARRMIDTAGSGVTEAALIRFRGLPERPSATRRYFFRRLYCFQRPRELCEPA